MTAPVDLSTTVRLRVEPARLWTFFADTDRLNRAIRLPAVSFTPLPDPSKKGHYRAESKFLCATLKYEEFPFDWVERRYYRVLRRFDAGPILEMNVGIRFRPFEGGTELEVFARIVPRNFIGRLAAKTALKKRATRDVVELARAFELFALDPETAAEPAQASASELDREQLAARMKPLGASDLAGRLERHLARGSDIELSGMRPFELADRWGCDRIETLRLFLHAVKSGLLDLVWVVLCPDCQVGAVRSGSLADVKADAHCATCGITFDADFAQSVEARFTPHPAVREAGRETYCIGGPANTPHVLAQLRLEPGEKREEEIDLEPGAHRIRCYQSKGVIVLKAGDAGGSGVRARCGAGGLEVDGTAVRSGVVELAVENGLDREALVVVDRETWRETAASAAQVTSIQDFRDLFPGQSLAPGEEVRVASLAFMFTDLTGSTQMYSRSGDAGAFGFVHVHFKYLRDCVARHGGAVVKTMGDAIMATFARARDAVDAAVDMQRGWDAFCESHGDKSGVGLKVGIHQGQTIALTKDEVLDYFGNTVNIAARTQARSDSGEIVFTPAVRDDPQVKAYLADAGLQLSEEQAVLKGVDGEVTLCRARC